MMVVFLWREISHICRILPGYVLIHPKYDIVCFQIPGIINATLFSEEKLIRESLI